MCVVRTKHARDNIKYVKWIRNMWAWLVGVGDIRRDVETQ